MYNFVWKWYYTLYICSSMYNSKYIDKTKAYIAWYDLLFTISSLNDLRNTIRAVIHVTVDTYYSDQLLVITDHEHKIILGCIFLSVSVLPSNLQYQHILCLITIFYFSKSNKTEKKCFKSFLSDLDKMKNQELDMPVSGVSGGVATVLVCDYVNLWELLVVGQ